MRASKEKKLLCPGVIMSEFVSHVKIRQDAGLFRNTISVPPSSWPPEFVTKLRRTKF